MQPRQNFIVCQTFAAIGIFALLSACAFATTPVADWSAVTNLPTRIQPSVAKLPRFFEKPKTPDVLLLGSSLVSMAAGRCDDAHKKVTPRSDSWYVEEYIARYAEAKYLSHKLSARTGRPVSVDNLAVLGATMSDDYLILKRTIQQHAAPTHVVCGIAPRDFVSNDSPDVEESHIFKVLSHPTESMLAPLPKGPIPKRLLQRGRLVCWMFKQRLLSFLTGGAIPNSPEVASDSAEMIFKNVASYTPKTNKFPDLWLYNFRYNPPNHKRLDEQLLYFEKLLALAKENNIRCSIVNMPLTPQNIALLDKQLQLKYKQNVASLCANYSAEFIDFDSLCKADDFEDSCHLNGTGGRKLFDAITANSHLIPTADERILADGTI